MPWRNWSVIAVLLLSNYLVFSMLAIVVFPPPPVLAPTHAAQPTFTPGAVEPQNVGAFSYDFLIPTATATMTLTPTVTLTGTMTLTGTVTPPGTVIPTRAP